MSYFSKKYNKERLFTVDTSEFEYKSLEELYGWNGPDYVYPVKGIYINKASLYDPAPVIATDDCYVNLPSHLYGTAVDMLNDKRAIAEINAGWVGFKIYEYEQKRFHKKCYSVTWCDYEEPEKTEGEVEETKETDYEA